MDLPEIVKRMGKIEGERKIYMEDYVLAYLQNYKTNTTEADVRVTLYGKKENNASGEIYLIYGAAESGKDFFREYDEIGCLNIELWKKSPSMCEGILLGDEIGGEQISGYYIFYDEAQAMKEYMGYCYEEDIHRKQHKRKALAEAESGKKQPVSKGQAELVALSSDTQGEEAPLYSYIRAAVIIIFIVFCAIAVTTVNSYGKMENFTQAAEQMHETLEQHE